jgi:hypothetical protein
MGKNARCLFNRRLCGLRFLGRKFGGEKILSLATENGRVLGVPCLKLDTLSIRNIHFSITTLYTTKYRINHWEYELY